MSKTNRENATCQLLLKNSSTSIDEYSAGPLDVVGFNSYRSSKYELRILQSVAFFLAQISNHFCPKSKIYKGIFTSLVEKKVMPFCKCTKNGFKENVFEKARQILIIIINLNFSVSNVSRILTEVSAGTTFR